jgi:ParB family chromosome partitioning protein
MIYIDKIDANPYQPETRREVPESEAADLAKSIQEIGLIHFPVVRPSPKTDGRYEMADGWRRLAAFRYLVKSGDKKYEVIAAEIRDLPDRAMADTILHSVHFRKDLNPIQQAETFSRYLKDFKVTQDELAKHNNLSQGELGNTLRLLQLPAEIQYLVANGTLPQTHARHLLRLNLLPKVQDRLVKDILKGEVTANELDRSIHRIIWQASKSLNPKSSDWPEDKRPLFEDKECASCEFRVMANNGYGNDKSEPRCMKKECWDKKQKAAVAARVEEVKKQVGGVQIFTNKDLPHDKKGDMSEYTMKELDNPGECKNCPKVALYKYELTGPGKPERVCTDPSCQRRKKSTKTKNANKVKVDQDKALTQTIVPVFQHAHKDPKSAVLVIARHTVSRISADAKNDILKAFPNLPKLANGRLDAEKLEAKIESMTLDELLDVVVTSIISDKRRAEASYGSRYSVKLSPELELDIATLEGNLEKYRAKITAWQELNCRHCHLAKLDFIGTGKNACGQTYNRKIDKNGNCSTGQQAQGKKTEAVEDSTQSDAEEDGLADAEAEGIEVKLTPKGRETGEALIHALHTNDAAKVEELTKTPQSDKIYVNQETLKALAEMNSCNTINQKPPRLAGVCKIDGAEYACIGSAFMGEKLLEATGYLLTPFAKSAHTPSQKPAGPGYNGAWGSYKGKLYELTGDRLTFLPKPVPTEKTEPLAGGKLPCETCGNDGKTCGREHFHVDNENPTHYICEHWLTSIQPAPATPKSKPDIYLPSVADIANARKEVNKEIRAKREKGTSKAAAKPTKDK